MDLIFFFDRSVGIHAVPEVFAACGHANATGADLAERALSLMPEIEVRAADDGPFIDGLYADGLQVKWPVVDD